MTRRPAVDWRNPPRGARVRPIVSLSLSVPARAALTRLKEIDEDGRSRSRIVEDLILAAWRDKGGPGRDADPREPLDEANEERGQKLRGER